MLTGPSPPKSPFSGFWKDILADAVDFDDLKVDRLVVEIVGANHDVSRPVLRR